MDAADNQEIHHAKKPAHILRHAPQHHHGSVETLKGVTLLAWQIQQAIYRVRYADASSTTTWTHSRSAICAPFTDGN